MQDAYRTTGYVRHRAIEDHVWHQTNKPPPQPLPIQQGKIIEVRQHENTCDIRLLDGTILRHVPLSSPFSGTNYGSYRAPRIQNAVPDRGPQGSLDTFQKTGARDSYVYVGFIGGGNLSTSTQRPFVLGYEQPEVNQLTNTQISSLDRHHNDQVDLITDAEDTVSYSPDFSGTVRTPDASKPLPYFFDPGVGGPPDFDKKWRLINEGDKKFNLFIHQGSGDTTICHNADGRWQIHKGDGQGGTKASVEIHDNGHVTIHSTVGHTFDAPTHTFTGVIYANGGIQSPGTIQTATLIAAAGQGPPSPLGASGSPGSAGPVTPHDYPMPAPYKNPNTGPRDSPTPPNDP